MKRNQAFSLIELLIVIAILAVLLALAFPILSSARQSALDTRSFNNLRQIGAALTTFIADHNGVIMPRAYLSAADTPTGQSRYWTATLYNNKYLPDARAFYDPRFAPYGPDETATSKRLDNGTPATYGMRDWVMPGQIIHTSYTRVAKRVVIVTTPADFFIVADSYWVAWETQGYGISPGTDGDNRIRLDKQGMAGALFLDGHVAKKPQAYFESLGNTQGDYSAGQSFPTWRTPTKG